MLSKGKAAISISSIDVLELKTAKLAIFIFTRMYPDVKLINLHMDNNASLLYIVKIRETHYMILSEISKEIWGNLPLKGITMSV